ncbi:hypothetical protein A3Q56_01275 [Intoshia linei]|uniref:adenylate cyclase n=1 Tax=Intoshia linei TaxID=1819745 RepID=A0A177B9L6_9BILA|nr:hypothetical protein A3Q56_01275 [Intoshia linei]
MKKLNKIQEGPYEIKQKSKNTETESSISSHKISRSNVINPITVALLKSQKKKMSLIGFTFYDRNYAKQIMYQFRKNLVFIFMIIFIRDCLNIYFTYIRSQNNELKYNHEMDDNVNKIGLSLNQTYLHQNRTNRVGAKIRQPTYNYNIYLVIFIFVSNMLLFIVIYILSHVKRVSGNYMSTLITATIILLGYSSLTTFIIYGSESSIIPHTFISVTSSIIMIYSLMPLKFITTFLISLFITLSYNFINILVTLKYDENNFKIKYVYLHLNQVIGECVLQMCLHLLGIYIFCNSKKRRVATHKNIKKSIDMQNELEMENNRYKKLIYSFIPIRFANMILSSKFKEDENIDVPKKFNKFNKFTRFFYRKKPYNKKKVTKLSIQYSEYLKLDDEKFEKLKAFSIEKMNNVSILFADIVGFTKMSSTKTAHTIVELLNFLFHKFDDLCESNNCEKIGTIGDCYYAVSGCPEPCENHAKNCIEFGLGMIEIIREFDEKYNENVKMRIGVHSGSILCGIVGTTRFKFDIWSNDVTIANRLESDGIANMIHISNMTAQLVNGQYNLIDGKSMEYVYKRTLVEKYIDGRFVSQIENEKKRIFS